MYKFVKKPVVIEAFQMTRERRWDNSEWPEWLNYAWNFERDEVGAVYPTVKTEPSQAIPSEVNTLSIQTLEGEHLVSWDDYIIKGVEGELYLSGPYSFEKTYEPF